MSASISLQPMAVTNAAGLFQTNSNGFTQGDAQDDPAVKFALSGGVLSTSATTPLWGGVPISEDIPAASTVPGSGVLGSTIIQATADANATGICVFNQAYGGITTPQSDVPLFSPGMSVNFYRFGSGARIPLRCSASLVSLDGGLITQQVSYDYAAQELVPYDSSNAFPVKVLRISVSNNRTVSYNSGTGNANWATNEYVALCLI
jgi:hypothetical protein